MVWKIALLGVDLLCGTIALSLEVTLLHSMGGGGEHSEGHPEGDGIDLEAVSMTKSSRPPSALQKVCRGKEGERWMGYTTEGEGV